MTLSPIVEDRLWHAPHEVKFGPLMLTTRATFVRLVSGGVWVHSPVPLTGSMASELEAIGPVRFVVAPNRFHHLFFREFIEQFPAAQGFLAPGLTDKRPDLAGYATLDEKAATNWSEDFDSVFVAGLPTLNETVWLHRETGTLILTDLLFCFAPGPIGLRTIVARLIGVYDRLAMSRTERLMVKDKAAFARSIEQILAWDVQRIVLAHDQIIESGAKEALRRAFAWLR